MTRFADSALLNDAARRACRYLEDLAQRPVAPPAAALAGLEQLGGALPDDGMAPSQVLALLDDAGSPATVASAGGRYFGFVTGALHPPALAVIVIERIVLSSAIIPECYRTILPVKPAGELLALLYAVEILE